jgi:hypothetical protein
MVLLTCKLGHQQPTITLSARAPAASWIECNKTLLWRGKRRLLVTQILQGLQYGISQL